MSSEKATDGWLIWVLILCAVGMLFIACDQQPGVSVDAGADALPALEEAEPGRSLPHPLLGSLPLGYYERQCQWDACGGPLPDRSGAATNPAPEERP